MASSAVSCPCISQPGQVADLAGEEDEVPLHLPGLEQGKGLAGGDLGQKVYYGGCGGGEEGGV